MRPTVSLALLVLLPAVSFAQPKDAIDAITGRLDTLKYVQSLETPNGGFAPAVPKGDVKPVASLRATLAAVRAWKYLGGEQLGSKLPHPDKHAAFVLSCFDPKTGGFADTPDGKVDVALTAVGVMAAVELGIPKEKFAKAMDYLKANAKTFEDVRIGAAAVEAWGVKDCPFDLKPWFEIANESFSSENSPSKPVRLGFEQEQARDVGSLAAFWLRLHYEHIQGWLITMRKFLPSSQADDGGWGKKGEKGSELEATYRVMRAIYLFHEKPKDAAKLRAFVAKCRNADGGYGVKPGEASAAGPTYYAAIVTHWLDAMGKK